ncbi:MAG TPA: T9SS type A sorting domain-containing protein, partial [Bacteroidota bacterium]|nr:T9SS type A sorting domain-containing protein [Bacteroidota bacterium]
KSGSTVQITARPNSGWKLSQWIGVGKGSYSGTDTTASVAMDSVITETAAFEPATGISDLKLGIPSTFVLNGNYPNPFNPTTTIRFGVPTRSAVRITVYNILGALVARLVEEEVSAGYHEVRFDATNLASGMYLYRMQAGSFVQTKSLLLVK